MAASDSGLRNEVHGAIKVCYNSGETASETVKLMKEAYNDKCFGKTTIFRRYDDFYL